MIKTPAPRDVDRSIPDDIDGWIDTDFDVTTRGKNNPHRSRSVNFKQASNSFGWDGDFFFDMKKHRWLSKKSSTHLKPFSAMIWDQKRKKWTFHLCRVLVALILKILLKVIWETVGSLLELLLLQLDQDWLTELWTQALMQVEITAISSGKIECKHIRFGYLDF